MTTEERNSKICVAGIGGVGGIVGGALARTFPHVSFLARGARKEAIQENGLLVKSEYLGDFQVRPEQVSHVAEELGRMDLVFICVKNYSLEQVCRTLAPVIDDKTIVVPIMNGVDPAERTRKYLGKGMVMDALIYIVAGSQEDFSVAQKGDYIRIFMGRKNATEEELEAMGMVYRILKDAGIECNMDLEVETIIWKKYVLNCAFNILTAYYSADTGELRKDPRKVQEFKCLLEEACLVGRTAGIKIPANTEEEHMRHFLSVQSEDATSSLRRDMDAGRENELETFSGYLIRLGKQYGLKLPVTEEFYEKLKHK